MTNNIKLMNDQLSSIDVDFVDEFQFNNNQDSIHKRNGGSLNMNYHNYHNNHHNLLHNNDFLDKPRV